MLEESLKQACFLLMYPESGAREKYQNYIPQEKTEILLANQKIRELWQSLKKCSININNFTNSPFILCIIQAHLTLNYSDLKRGLEEEKERAI